MSSPRFSLYDDSHTLSDLSCDIDELLPPLEDKDNIESEDFPPPIPQRSALRPLSSMTGKRNAMLVVDTDRAERGRGEALTVVQEQRYGGVNEEDDSTPELTPTFTPRPLRWRKYVREPVDNIATAMESSSEGELHTIVLRQSVLAPVSESPLAEAPVERYSPAPTVSTPYSTGPLTPGRTDHTYMDGSRGLLSTPSPIQQQQWPTPLTSPPPRLSFSKARRRDYLRDTNKGSQGSVFAKPLHYSPAFTYDDEVGHADAFFQTRPLLSGDRSLGSFFEKEDRFTPLTKSYTGSEGAAYPKFPRVPGLPHLLDTRLRYWAVPARDRADGHNRRHDNEDEADRETGYKRVVDQETLLPVSSSSPTAQARAYLANHYAQEARAHAHYNIISVMGNSQNHNQQPSRIQSSHQLRFSRNFFSIPNATSARQVHFEDAFRRLNGEIPDVEFSHAAWLQWLDQLRNHLAGGDDSDGANYEKKDTEEERKRRYRASIRANTPYGGQFVS